MSRAKVVAHPMAPTFKMKVLSERPCEGDLHRNHLAYQVIDPDGELDWVCANDLLILEAVRVKESNNEDDKADDKADESDCLDTGQEIALTNLASIELLRTELRAFQERLGKLETKQAVRKKRRADF